MVGSNRFFRSPKNPELLEWYNTISYCIQNAVLYKTIITTS